MGRGRVRSGPHFSEGDRPGGRRRHVELGTLAVYLLNKYAGTDLNAEAAAGIATALATVRLWVGRRGIKAAVLSLWQGSPPTSPKP